jgi:long-subunit fatty acid transport protein
MVIASHSQTVGRTTSNYAIELNSSLSVSSWTLTPTFTYRKWNQHTVEFGIGTNIADSWNWPPKPFTGLVITSAYKFYPIGKEHKLNFYFHYNLKHYMYLSKLDGHINSITRHYNEHFLGYGFEVPIGKRFYFNHDLGAGILIEWGWSPGADVDLNGNFRIGFGYKIGIKD